MTWLLICAYSIWRGGVPEKVAALACLGNLVAVIILQDRVHWIDPERRMLIADGALLLIFAALVSSYRRSWLAVATAAQFLTVALHFLAARAIRAFHALAYLELVAALSYVVIGALLWGAVQSAGRDRPWTSGRHKDG